MSEETSELLEIAKIAAADEVGRQVENEKRRLGSRTVLCGWLLDLFANDSKVFDDIVQRIKIKKAEGPGAGRTGEMLVQLSAIFDLDFREILDGLDQNNKLTEQFKQKLRTGLYTNLSEMSLHEIADKIYERYAANGEK